MKDVTITEERSDNFGEKDARVISYRHPSASMDFVIKKGNHCSVSLCSGTIEGMKDITLMFIETYKPATLVNQVHSVPELRAMYKAGFRYQTSERKLLHLKATLDRLTENPSICLAWKGVFQW